MLRIVCTSKKYNGGVTIERFTIQDIRGKNKSDVYFVPKGHTLTVGRYLGKPPFAFPLPRALSISLPCIGIQASKAAYINYLSLS